MAKLNIPLNSMSLIDRKEWFTLKNSREENCLMVLMSFADMREKKSREISNSVYIENGNCSIISNQSLENRMKVSVIVNKPKYNFSTEGRSRCESNACNKKECQGKECSQQVDPNNFNLDFNRRNSASNIPIDFRIADKSLFVLPPSQRNHPDSNNTMNTLHQVRIIKGDETGYLTTLDSVLMDQNDWMGLDLNSNTHHLFNTNSQSHSETFILGEKERIRTKQNLHTIDENEKINKIKETLRLTRESKFFMFL